jgi:hypothetical protein
MNAIISLSFPYIFILLTVCLTKLSVAFSYKTKMEDDKRVQLNTGRLLTLVNALSNKTESL